MENTVQPTDDFYLNCLQNFSGLINTLNFKLCFDGIKEGLLLNALSFFPLVISKSCGGRRRTLTSRGASKSIT